MKRILPLLLAVLLILSFVGCRGALSSSSLTLEHPNGTSYFVCHLDTGDTEYAGEDEIIYPASITKLLTALTALDILAPDTLITPGEEVYLIPERSTIAYVRPQHTLTLEMLIEGMLLPSGGDAAYAIATACGKVLADEDIPYTEAIARFVEAMNDKAAALGCTDSHFTVPDGYDGNENRTTVRDLALIARAAAESPLITAYAGLASDDVIYESGHTNTWVNTNQMLDPASPYYDPAVRGLKTGSLDNNYSLIILADVDGSPVLIGVFGSRTDAGRYKDAAALLDLVREPSIS